MTEDNKKEIKLLAPITKNIPKDAKGKVDFFIEIVLIFILGILIGIAVKTEAIKKITMGYNDYKIKVETNHYSINQLEKNLIKKQSAIEEDRAPASLENSKNE